MKKPKVILMWEDNKGKFHKTDARKAIPNIVEDMQKNLDQYRTLTLKINSKGGTL